MNAKQIITAVTIAFPCWQTASVAADQLQPKRNDVCDVISITRAP